MTYEEYLKATRKGELIIPRLTCGQDYIDWKYHGADLPFLVIEESKPKN